MEESVKQIMIAGAAYVDYQKAKGLIKQNARRSRMTRKKEQEGGFEEPPAPRITNLKNANITRLGAASNPMKGGMEGETPKKKEIHPLSQTPQTNVNPQTPSKPANLQPKLSFTSPASSNKQQGGNVVTTPGHQQNPQNASTPLPAVQAGQEAGTQDVKEGGSKGKIELAPSKKNKTRHGIVLAPPRESKKRHVRGHTRKIRVQLSNMKRRMHTAKLIHRQSSEKSIGEIRKLLEDAKLIKPGKASVPESLLRHMYRDYLVLRSKAL